MSDSVYAQRMESLDTRKAEKVQQMFPNLSRPSPIRRGNINDLNGNLAPETPEEEQADMDSAFGTSFNKYVGEDSRFQQMMEDYKQLAGVLRQKVQKGFMPEVIAQDQLKRFLTDGRGHFSQNKAQPQDNPQLMGALQGAMGELAAENQPQPIQEEGQAPQGQPMPPQGQPNMMQGGM